MYNSLCDIWIFNLMDLGLAGHRVDRTSNSVTLQFQRGQQADFDR